MNATKTNEKMAALKTENRELRESNAELLRAVVDLRAEIEHLRAVTVADSMEIDRLRMEVGHV